MLLLSAIANANDNQGFFIEYAEPVQFSKNTLGDARAPEKRLFFSSFGQQFDLILQERSRLLNGYRLSRSDIKLYTGKIVGNSESWVRITTVGGEYSGAIYDGAELYLLDVGHNISDALTNGANIKQAKTVIYKSSQLTTSLSCGVDDQHASTFAYENLLTDQARQRLNSNLLTSEIDVAEANASQQLNLRIVADTQYAQSSSLDAEAQVISQMNIVDGIFSEQVGVQFGITDIEVLTDNGSLISSSASTLLGQFRTFVGANNPGLAHLFTGRDLDGNIIGIANLRGICRSFGTGVTQAGGRGTFGALTAAHEYGHNFGAPHDNQDGSVCEAAPGTFLMNPSLNGSDQFSQCSLSQIANTLVGAQCLIPVDTSPPEPAESCNFSIDFSSGANDFEFLDDPQSPLYSSGSALGGSLTTMLGGVDDEDISDIEGTWSRQCLNEDDDEITFTIQASLTQSPEYEANEISQLALRVNGTTTILDTVSGNGNGGAPVTNGTQQYSVNIPLTPGLNTVELVCLNNLKTQANETTQCQFDRLETSEVAPGNDQFCVPIRAQNSNLALICL